MTIYCYDTEFLEDGSTIDLISIGIVCADGREYYAVNNDMDEKRIKKDDWLCENVIRHLPLLGTGYKGQRPYKSDTGSWVYALDKRSVLVKPKWVIANEVREFLLADGEPQLWAYYAAYDHVALAQLWGKMIHRPKGLPMWTHDLMQLIEPLNDFEKPEQDGVLHNALADARWNMKLLNAALAVRDST